MLSDLVCHYRRHTQKSGQFFRWRPRDQRDRNKKTSQAKGILLFLFSSFLIKCILTKLCLFNVKEQNSVEGILLSPHLGSDTGKGRRLSSTMFRSLEWLQACVCLSVENDEPHDRKGLDLITDRK